MLPVTSISLEQIVRGRWPGNGGENSVSVRPERVLSRAGQTYILILESVHRFPIQCQQVAVSIIESSISWNQRSFLLCCQRGQHGPFTSSRVRNKLNMRSGDWQVSTWQSHSLANSGSFNQRYGRTLAPRQ